jgi:hypothetical protein
LFDSPNLWRTVTTQDRCDTSDEFIEFIEKMARLLVPEDEVEDMRGRRG